jgi:hypothetical protein
MSYILSADCSLLLHAAKMLIVRLSQENTDGGAEPSPYGSSDNDIPTSKRFQFLSSSMTASASQPVASNSSIVLTYNHGVFGNDDRFDPIGHQFAEKRVR